MNEKENRLEALLYRELLKRIIPVYICILAYSLYTDIPSFVEMLTKLAKNSGIMAAVGLTVLNICLLLIKYVIALPLAAALLASFVKIFWPFPQELEEYDPEWNHRML